MAIVSLCLLMATCLVGSFSGTAGAARKFLSIATASIGGSYYPIGVGIAEIVNRCVPDVEMKVEVTGGGLENPKLVGTGEADLGFTNHFAYMAYHGEPPYDRKYSDLRLLFAGVSPGAYQIVVRADSGIRSLSDLKGKRVAMGPQGGGAIVQFPLMLEFHNLTMNDFRASYMSYDEGILALTDGRVDAALVAAPVPSPAITSLAASKRVDFRIITWSPQVRDAFLQKYPYFAAVDIPGSVYGLPDVTHTVGTVNVVIANAKLSEDLVYKITKSIFDNLATLQQSHPSATSIDLASAVSVRLIPFHPGAERYYKERGVLK
jgi:TRAP transporter TAXI family solute receptor